MKIHDEFHQGHEAWEEWRAVRATASEFGKIFTGGGKRSAQRESYMRRLAISRKYKLPEWAGNEFTDRGKELEPIARQMFCDLSGLEVTEIACIEHDNNLCGGSPDGLIYTPGGDLVSGIEIKCYNFDKHVGIATKKELPTDCKPQVHGHLFLSGLPSWQFVVYHPDALPLDFQVIEVTPDDYTMSLESEVLEFCEELAERADEFIAEFEASLRVSIIDSMPVLKSMLKTKPEESLI